MDIKVVTISLSAEESARALPALLQTISAVPTSLPAQSGLDETSEVFSDLPESEPEEAFADEIERRSVFQQHSQKEDASADAQLLSLDLQSEPFNFEPWPPSPNPSAVPTKFPVEDEAPLPQPKVAKPTGSLKKARTMILDENGCYRRRTLWDRVVGACDRLDSWCGHHAGILITVIGGSVGLGLLFLCIQLDATERIRQQFFDREAPAVVEPASEESDVVETSPSDASDKSGQPEKLPLSEGAIK